MVYKEEFEYLRTLAVALDAAARQGTIEDVPEGSRYLVLSDTFAREMAKKFRDIVLSLTLGPDGEVY